MSFNAAKLFARFARRTTATKIHTNKQKRGYKRRAPFQPRFARKILPPLPFFYSLFSPFFRGLISKPPRARKLYLCKDLLYFTLSSLEQGTRERKRKEKEKKVEVFLLLLLGCRRRRKLLFPFFYSFSLLSLSPIERHASKEAAALQRRCCRLCRSHHVRRGPLDAFGRGRGEGAGSRPRAGPRLGGSRAPP